MTKNHPYEELEKLPIWKVLRKGIKDLEANGDLEARTSEQYIVGYLAKLLSQSNLLAERNGKIAKPSARIKVRDVPKSTP